MPSIDIQKYKKNVFSFFEWIKQLTVSDVLSFIVACVFVISLLSFSKDVFLKQYIITLLILLASIIGLVAAVFNESIQFPKTKVWYALAGIVVAVFLSALISPVAREGIIGYGTEVDTALFIGIWVLLIVLASTFIDSNKKTHASIFVLGVGSAIIILLQLIGAVFFKGNIGLVSSVVEISILSVFIITLALGSDQFAVRFFNKQILQKSFVFFLVLLGLIGMFVANYFLGWVVVGLVALCGVLYVLFQKMQTHVPVRIPWLSIAVFFIALIGMFVGSISGSWLHGSTFNDPTKPSLHSTIEVTRVALLEHPIFGVGPNQFAYLWDSKKTVQDIVSPISHVQYSLGFAYFPTFIATTGILGLLAFVSFFVLFVGLGISVIRKILMVGHHDTVTLMAWILSFILFIFTLITTPDFSIIILTAITAGIALGSSVINGYIFGQSIAVSINNRRSKIIVSSLTLVFILFIIMSYTTTRSIVAYASYRSVLKQPIDATLADKMVRIINLRPHDVYYRALTDVYVNLLQKNVSQKDANVDIIRSLVQGAVTASQKAISYNPNNYRNLKKAGDISTILGQLQVEGAYAQAKDLYTQALDKKPYSTDVLLALADLYQIQNDKNKVRDYANIARSVSPQNPSVYITMARLALSEKDLKGATQYVSLAVSVKPNDGNLWLELGGLLYQQSDYENASRAFMRSIELYPIQDAYYYLGLSLKKLGRDEEVTQIYNFLKEKGATVPIQDLIVEPPVPVAPEVPLDEKTPTKTKTN